MTLMGTMNASGTVRRVAGIAVAAAAVLAAAASPASADLERIREKAVELKQKLNRHRYEVEVRGDKSNTQRIYKDFEFLLKDSKVNEAKAEVGTDPHADRLRQFLIESTVNLELASYVDDLNNQLNTVTSTVDDKELPYAAILARLGAAADDAERRKLITALKPLVERANVFRNQIAQRAVDNYKTWGYADFAAFYAEREHVDLDALAAQADDFLAGSQALYDSLFTEEAASILGMEARKVRFSDLPYLTEGAGFRTLFAPAERPGRAADVFRGLGVDLGSVAGLTIDTKDRPGRPIGGGVYPFVVPSEVTAGFLPTASLPDEDMAVTVRAEALFYSLSAQTAFETAYLAPHAPQAAVFYLVRSVRDENGWLDAHVKLGDQAAAYRRYRAFARLLEARATAATFLYELALYRGDIDAESVFKARMGAATGIRLSSSDSARALELANFLDSAAHFQGLLWSGRLLAAMHDKAGETWFTDGKARDTLLGCWKQGGALTAETLAAAFGPLDGGADALLEQIRSHATE